MDRELLAQYGKGLIATTGCPSGEVQTRLRLGQYDEAVRGRREFHDIFGAENYFFELMDHGLDIERRVHEGPAAAGARTSSLPLVATNDLHYTHAARTPRRTRRCCASSPARRWPTRTGSSSTATATTSSRRRRCAHLCARAARRPATTPC